MIPKQSTNSELMIPHNGTIDRHGSALTSREDLQGARHHENLAADAEEVAEEVIDRNWTPPVTRAVRLVSIIDDASMHSGQAVYVRRLLGLAD